MSGVDWYRIIKREGSVVVGYDRVHVFCGFWVE